MHIIHWGRDYYQGRCHNRRALAAVVEHHELPFVLRHAHLRGGQVCGPSCPWLMVHAPAWSPRTNLLILFVRNLVRKNMFSKQGLHCDCVHSGAESTCRASWQPSQNAKQIFEQLKTDWAKKWMSTFCPFPHQHRHHKCLPHHHWPVPTKSQTKWS